MMFRFSILIFIIVCFTCSNVYGNEETPLYLQAVQYEVDNCSGVIEEAVSILMNTCVYDGEYIMYTCDSTSYTVYYCSDSLCSVDCEIELYNYTSCEDGEQFICGNTKPYALDYVYGEVIYTTSNCTGQFFEAEYSPIGICDNSYPYASEILCGDEIIYTATYYDGNGTCTGPANLTVAINFTDFCVSEDPLSVDYFCFNTTKIVTTGVITTAEITTGSSTSVKSTSNGGTSSKSTSNAGTSNAGTSNAGTSNAGTSNAGTSNAGTSTGSKTTSTHSSANINVVSFIILFIFLFNSF